MYSEATRTAFMRVLCVACMTVHGKASYAATAACDAIARADLQLSHSRRLSS